MVRAAQLAHGSYVSAAGADVSTARAAVGSRGGSPVAELATRRVRETRGEAQVVTQRRHFSSRDVTPRLFAPLVGD